MSIIRGRHERERGGVKGTHTDTHTRHARETRDVMSGRTRTRARNGLYKDPGKSPERVIYVSEAGSIKRPARVVHERGPEKCAIDLTTYNYSCKFVPPDHPDQPDHPDYNICAT